MKKKGVLGFLLSLVFSLTGIFSINVAADEYTLDQYIYEIMNGLMVGTHHSMHMLEHDVTDKFKESEEYQDGLHNLQKMYRAVLPPRDFLNSDVKARKKGFAKKVSVRLLKKLVKDFAKSYNGFYKKFKAFIKKYFKPGKRFFKKSEVKEAFFNHVDRIETFMEYIRSMIDYADEKIQEIKAKKENEKSKRKTTKVKKSKKAKKGKKTKKKKAKKKITKKQKDEDDDDDDEDEDDDDDDDEDDDDED